MSTRFASFASFAVALGLAVAASGCHAGKPPEMRVIGVHDTARDEVVFVQVSNPASRPMRLTKLDYAFAADGSTVSTGELSLEREVPAGAVVVVEVPLTVQSGPTSKLLTLQGTLTAELDKMIHTFAVSAQIQPH